MTCFPGSTARLSVWLLALLLMSMLAGCATSTTTQGMARGAGKPDFQRAGDHAPTPQTLHALANILAAKGKHRESAALLRRIMHEHPRYVPAYSKMAELYIQADRLSDAADVLQAALEVAPDDAVLHNNLGMCHMLADEHEAALASFTEASRIDPDNATYQANRAATMGMLGRYDETLAIYKRIMPAHEAHHNLAVLCEVRDDSALASEHRARARALRIVPALHSRD